MMRPLPLTTQNTAEPWVGPRGDFEKISLGRRCFAYLSDLGNPPPGRLHNVGDGRHGADRPMAR
jgi:hypothetical protein